VAGFAPKSLAGFAPESWQGLLRNSHPSKEECDFLKNNCSLRLQKFIELSIYREDLWTQLISYRKNSDLFRGVVDINYI